MYNVDFLVRSFHTTHNVEHGTSLLVRLSLSQALKKWSEDLKVQRRIADDDKRCDVRVEPCLCLRTFRILCDA